MHTRHTEIRLQPAHPRCYHDAEYVVECWEYGKLIATIPCGEHSRHYADSIADNWFCGVLTVDKIDSAYLTNHAAYAV